MEVHSHEHRHFMPKRPHGLLGLGEAKYKEMYQESINDPAAFWGRIGKTYDWFKPVRFVACDATVLASSYRAQRTTAGRHAFAGSPACSHGPSGQELATKSEGKGLGGGRGGRTSLGVLVRSG